ncbi:putative prefoldin subunit [Lachnellula occidentalis]|uniref:Putative prefoldin subunit n=1 Tax=Lachnellula occidentalis TaxID=215460 RepID=A0A8H8S1C1_9HELO|nr:putative prefoldin subunit [Lachnellula occidentalis]
MASSPKGQGIDITSLSMQQLSQIKKQFEDELTHLSNSFTQLRAAQVKFRECLRSIELGVSGKVEGKPILVPLTASLYVPGTLADTENVVVDVGTGFYVEKSTKDATGFYECYGRKLSALVLLHLHRDAISENGKVRLGTIASGQKAMICQEGDMNAELNIPQNWRRFSQTSNPNQCCIMSGGGRWLIVGNQTELP